MVDVTYELSSTAFGTLQLYYNDRLIQFQENNITHLLTFRDLFVYMTILIECSYSIIQASWFIG